MGKLFRFLPSSLVAMALLGTSSLAQADAQVRVSEISFTPNSIAVGGTSSLQFELRNNGLGGQRATIDPTNPLVLAVPTGLAFSDLRRGDDCDAAAGAVVIEVAGNNLNVTALTLSPAGSCTVGVSVSANEPGNYTASHSTNNDPPTLVVTGLEVPIEVSQTEVPFPPQEVGIESAAKTLTVANYGASRNIEISVTGADFSASSCLPTPVPPEGTCTFSVRFKPTATGDRLGSVQITGTETTVAVSGRGIAPSPSLSSPPDFGSVPVNTSVTRTVTLTNTSSATAALTIEDVTVSGPFFSSSDDCPPALAVESSCTITVTYAPTEVGSHSGQLNVLSNTEANSLVLALSATATSISLPVAPAMQLSSSRLAFNLTFLNMVSGPRTVTVTNAGTGPMQISSITTIGDFGYSGCGFPSIIAPGASCMLSITFRPLSGGPLEGSIRIVSDAPGSPHSIALSGTGALVLNPAVSLAPAALDFGTLRVGSDAVSVMRLTNVGNMALTISAISSAGSMFSQTNDCPASLAVAAFCDIEVTYAPTSAGAHSGQVRIVSNATPSEHIAALSGTGIPVPPAFMVVDRLMDFGQQLTESVTRAALAISNTGGKPLVISQMRLFGTPEFGIEGNCAVIEPKDTCSMIVLFAPTAEGVLGGRIEIVSNHFGGMVTVDLVGQGIARPRADLELLVEGLGFGNQVVGSVSDTRPVGVTNVGTLPLQFLGFDLPLDFNVDSRQCPVQLMPGQSCELLVTFKPIVPGPRAGHLSIISNAIGAPHSVSLTGTGCRFFSMRAARDPQRLCAP
jgi:hypothetical protein